MHPTSSLRLRHGRPGILAAVAASVLALFAACKSGGGGGGVFAVVSTIFGYDPFSGNFDASGQQGEAPLIPLNMCVVFEFSDSVQESSVNSSSVIVQELDTSVTPPAPGPFAAVVFDVDGTRVTICPLITFTDTNATFGWGDQNAEKTYQILFQIPPSQPTLTSTGGRALTSRDRGPYLFRTSKQIFDQNPGPPVPSMTLRDPVTGLELPAGDVATSPVPIVEITFDEPVIPASAVDPGGVGTSSNIHVELDTDGDLGTTPDRILIPGVFTLAETNFDATVTWTSLLTELPTDLPAGCLYVVTVDGTVQDLSGNDKVSSTNDPGAEDVFTFTTVPGPSTTPIDPLVELFDDQDANDLSVTSAKWGTTFPGFLSAGIGGGTGVDGIFDPDDPAFQASPPSGITVFPVLKKVNMQTESLITPGTQREFEFTTFEVPLGWSVFGVGPFPLSIQCSGSAILQGIIDVSGSEGAVFADGSVTGGAGGAAALGGAAGGRGGATTDSLGTNTFFPTRGGSNPTYPALAFFAANPAFASQGLSGRNTALDSTLFTLTDGNSGAELDALPDLTNLWIQPNVGADDYRFERHHPAFKVESIAAGVVTVVSDPADPDFQGELSQETENPWLEDDGSGGFRAPLLSEQFDAYVIGELAGLPGSNAFDLDLDGVAAEAAKVNPGDGSLPQSVMQTFLTLGRSGGGGGGGYTGPGSDGADDPTVTNGPGAFGGTGGTGGAGGAGGPAALLAQRIDGDTLRTASNLFEDPATGLKDSTFVGHLVNPNVNQGNTFIIASVDDVDTVTILPITTATGIVIDLNSTTMAPGNTVRVTPPYAAGGTGGGGAGVHCAGSSKNPAGHEGHPSLAHPKQDDDGNADGNGPTRTAGFYDDDNDLEGGGVTQDGREDGSESIFTLPRWVPGGGGGSGGGSLRIAIAGSVDLGGVSAILAEGGEGGRSDLAGASAASGGGGGSGGTVFVGAGGNISAAIGAVISTAGGIGGAQGFGVEGGAGAPGRIRLENGLGNLLPAGFTGVGNPPIAAEHLGTFAGGGKSLAQSILQPCGALDPEYQKVVVRYTTKENGTTISATYTVNRDGSVDPSSTLPVPPFTLALSLADSDPLTGFADPATVTTFADPTVTFLSTYDGLPFVRFKIVLEDASLPVVIGADSYTDVRIDDLEIHCNSVKP